MGAGLLGQHGVAGEARGDALEHQPLGAAVVLGHEVDEALALERVGPAVAFAQDRPGLARHLDRGVAEGDRIEGTHVGPVAVRRRGRARARSGAPGEAPAAAPTRPRPRTGATGLVLAAGPRITPRLAPRCGCRT